MPPNPHTAQAKALRQTKPARPPLTRRAFFCPTFMTRPLCQPIIKQEQRLAAERERIRRFLEGKSYTPQHIRITNATMPADSPWSLFTPPARADGEHHRRHPSKIGDRSVFLYEWGPRC